MADTDTETIPNGTGALSEEDERMKQRPADIDADVREMERRKRVEALMSSKMFREELERVLDQQLHEGGDAPLLQRIREMVGNRMHPGRGGGPSCVLPINDIRGIEGMGYEKGEKILRCKLAAVYRLVDLFGWTQTAGMAGQITARLNTAVEQVLTTPRGLLPHEVTASSLVKVDMQGAVVDQGTTNFPVNAEGFSVHGAVHAARPDLRCVLHVRSASVLAVSCTKRGLLPLCHEAALLGDIAYHQVPTGVLDNEEQEKLVRALGPHSKVLVLASAGALCCGSTLEEAFYAARNLTAAADVQLRLNSSPVDDLYLLSDATRKQIYEASRKAPSDQAKWRVGGEEFEALMRMLDNAGFRTGYIYRHPLIKNDVPKPKNDVEVPPAVSSLGYLLEEEELYRQGLWKKGLSGMSERERTRWLNSPNVYQKVEVLETGTADPRKITKWVDANTGEWVQDGSPAHSSTPVKIDTLQFVPKNTNPKEFKTLQQQIKDNRRADKISAGPQSHILEGVTWDEAAKLAEDAQATHTGDHVVLMGAASKGIIQRGYQHNATVYAAPYARNPFDHVTDTEIAEYRRVVERKQKGDYDTDLSESEALSGAQLTSPASARDDDEARDGMGRVLRIETAQAPVRSQPEVVLSDDATDFLHAERAHADRTKALQDEQVLAVVTSSVTSSTQAQVVRAQHNVVREQIERRDPNLLPDDEVFYDSPVSPSASSVTSPVELTAPAPLISEVRKEPIVVVRASVQIQREVVTEKNLVRSPVLQRPLRGTLHAASEALSANKRSVYEYSRNANFKNTVQKFESIDPAHVTHPKCKVSLNSKLSFDRNDNFDPKSTNATFDVNSKLSYLDMTYKLGKKPNPGNVLELYQAGRASSQSSLCSIPSIEWDGRNRSEYALRTRSLPRKLKNTASRLYRTQSHCGFVNFNKDPEPTHYHLPRCNSCGATNTSYAWEVTKEERRKKCSYSLYESVGNLHQKCLDELEIQDVVKVTENYVPVFKVAKLKDSDSEFVESQEFTEDNYLGDLGNSFTSEDKTVIEKMHETVQEVTLTEITAKDVAEGENVAENEASELSVAENNNTESAPAVYESEDVNNNTMDSVEGEYHSFTDEMDFDEAVYESPVKELVEKDIRDYSVPMDVYFKDYKQMSPEKTHQKRQDVNKGVLEPILEESKSSYDDSGNASNEKIDLKPEEQDEEVKVIDVQVIHYNYNVSSESSKTCLYDIKIEDENNDLEAASLDTLTQNDEVSAIKISTLTINLQGDSVNERKASADEVQNQIIIGLVKDHETQTTDEPDRNTKLETDLCIKQPFENIIVNELLHRVEDAIQLKNDLSNCQSNVDNYILELESIHQRESYIIADEDSEYTTNDIEMVANVVQTAMDVYSNLDDDQDMESAIVDNIYKNVYDFLSIDAISSESKQKLSVEYSVTSSVELKSFDSTAEFEKYEAVADVIANILNKIDIENKIVDVFVNLPKEKTGSHFEVEKYKSGLLLEASYVVETKLEVVETNNEIEKCMTVAIIDEKDTELECDVEENEDGQKHQTEIEKEETQVLHIENVSFERIVTENVLQSEQMYEDTASQDSSHEANNSEIREQTEDFSIVKMIQDLELNVNLNETVLTEASDTELSHTYKIIEGVLYYMLNQVFFTVTDKAKANKARKLKKVITVVDFEDILLTTSPVLLGELNIESIDDEKIIKCAAFEHTKLDDSLVEIQSKNQDPENTHIDIKLEPCEPGSSSLDKEHIEEITTKESVPDAILDEASINFKLETEDCNSDIRELFFGYLELTPTNDLEQQFEPSTQGERQDNSLTETNKIDLQVLVTENFKQEENKTENAASAAIDFDKQTGVEEIEFCLNDALKKQQNIHTPETNKLKDYTKDLQVDENFKETFQLKEVKTHEHSLDPNYQSVIEVHKEESSLNETKDFVSIAVSENIFTVQSENFTDSADNSKLLQERIILNTEDTDHHHDVTSLEHTTFMHDSDHDETDDFKTASQSVQDSTEIATDLVTSILQQSFNDYDTSHCCSDADQLSSDTYVLNETEDLNNAFVETNDYLSRSSSPNKKPSVFEICTESPIRNPSNSFVGEDLSVLYKNNDTILGSPFVKQAPMIAMSQSANSGGIKYWLSFDDSVSEIRDKPTFRSVRKSKQSNFPSFVTVDFKEEKKKQQFWNEYEKDTYKRSSILDLNQSQTDNILSDDLHQSEPCISNLDSRKTKRRSILLADLDQSSDSNLKIEDSFISCLSTDYNTCESGQSSKYESCEPKKVLLYDSRVDLHTMSTKRQYASWPPFEDTLFYRIISKFRMSESFDPNDFEDLHIDVSL